MVSGSKDKVRRETKREEVTEPLVQLEKTPPGVAKFLNVIH